MKITILRNTVANGQAVNVGQVIDVPEQEGKYLVTIGKAEAYVEPKAAQIAPVHQAVEIETADLKPAMETAVKPRGKRKE